MLCFHTNRYDTLYHVLLYISLFMSSLHILEEDNKSLYKTKLDYVF